MTVRDAFYGLPYVRHRSLEEFDPGRGRQPVIHEVPYQGLSLRMVVRTNPGAHLSVLFHGAIDRAKTRLPYFERLRSTLERPDPFVIFADPTLDEGNDLRLGWYLGSADVDPAPALLAVTRRVQEAAGAAGLIFQGSSGGGFAALRLSALVPGSVALAFSPQTVVTRYYPSHVRKLLETRFAGLSPAEVLARHECRFSAVALYRRHRPENRVYYVQNVSDEHHMQRHLGPFAEVFGLASPGESTSDERVRLVGVEQGPRHVTPTYEIYAEHLERARALLAS